jgi:hypothetical protein
LLRPAGAYLGLLALGCAGLAAGVGGSLAQGISEQQVRCMQLQQELAAAQGGGGGANREELGRIEQQIAQADRVFQGTQAAMEDAGCFDSFFIFGRGLVRSPKCINMNARVEDSRRRLTQLQQQRQVLAGGGGNRRRQAELQDALARSGCGGQVRQQRRGFFDFFGGRDEEEDELPRTPIYRSIDPNGRYRSVCVRLCDGFFYPIHYSTYGSLLGQDAQQCQSSCAAPAELYVYRNPGQEIEHAVSLTGSAYMDLPVALRYRKEYVKGCSCKQAEYNPTEIEAANKRAGIDTGPMPPAAAAAPATGGQPATQAAAPAAATGGQPASSTDVEITGTTPPADPAAPPPAQAAIPPAQSPPPPPAAAAPPPPPPASVAIERAPPAAKPATVPQRQKPQPPPAAAAPPPPASVAIERAPPAAKPATVPQRQKPPPPPAAAAPPPPSDAASADGEAPPEPAPKRRPVPASPKASPFAQF